MTTTPSPAAQLEEQLRALHDSDSDLVNSYPSCREYTCPCMSTLRAAAAIGRAAGLEEAAKVPVSLGLVGDKSSNKVMTMWAGIEHMRKAIRALIAPTPSGAK